jgi:2'-5' RNA ligase
VRCFVAIELDDALRRPLVRLLEERLPGNRNVRWVTPAQLHLTLKFIGEIENADLPGIQAALETAGASIKPFSIRLTEYGVFPNPARARVLWVGVRDSDSLSTRLAEIIDAELAKIGIPAETRPFTPHITLGRTKSPAGARVLSDVSRRLAKPDSEPGQVDHFTLFESTLSRGGAVYRAVHSVALGG